MKELKRRKGETLEVCQHRVAMVRIDEAFKRKAADMKGVRQNRNRKWRIAEAELKMTTHEEDRW
jgi:hypothetical protein